MSDCTCDDNGTTPTPTPPPCVPIVPSVECNRIRMFFGESMPTGSFSSLTMPGQLDKLYYTSQIDENHIKYGFKIENYSAQDLVDTGILSFGFGKIVDGDASNLFDLTEIELLAAGTWESWMTWLSAECVAIPEAFLQTPQAPYDFRSFGFYCLKDTGVDLRQYKIDGWKIFESLIEGDPKPFYSVLQTNIINAPNTNTNQSDRGDYYPQTLEEENCKFLIRSADVEKLVLCYEWLKNIHDTYYGKQFLVKIGEPVPPSGTNLSQPLDTLCIKDENGDFPGLSYDSGKAYFIDGDGSAQGYSLSDIIDNSGGFPDKKDNHIIGLNNLDWIQTESGKVGSFVKIGPYAEYLLNPLPNCPNLYTQQIYPKFSKNGSDCVNWKIDTSKLNRDSFVLASAEDAYTPDKQYLYISCSVSEKFYVDSYGTWAHITLADKVPMIPVDRSTAQGFATFDYILALANAYKPSPIDPLFNRISNPKNDDSVTGVLEPFFRFNKQDNDNHGAAPDSHILNLGGANSWCLIPEAAVIPFKSNLYRYGPFYYGDSSGGGVDVIFDEDIAPWNFIEANKTSLPIDYTYDSMENIGKKLASLSPRDLHKLEKGRITVAGLPCYCLSYWVDNPECYDKDNELGPTLLTDISVEYGSGGFNTTYNFSTYSPRLGKPEKYLTEAWKKNIKDTQYLNKYLKSRDREIDRNNQSYKLRLINGERGGNTLLPSQNLYYGPNILRKSTANSIMFSSYYLRSNFAISPDFDNYNNEEIYDNVPTSYPDDENCDKYICETEEPNTIVTPDVDYDPPPSGHRFYSFSDQDNAYSVQYIQNTYHQLSGMSLDGFHLPVSLRGANKDPNIKEYEKWPNNSTTPGEEPNQFKIVNNKLVPNSDWTNTGRVPRFSKRCENNGSFIEWDAIEPQGVEYDRTFSNNPGESIPSKTRDEIPPFELNTNNGYEYCYALQINQRYLNPILSVKNLLGDDPDNVKGWDKRKNDSDKGFVISSIVFGQDHIDYQISHTTSEYIESSSIEEKDTDEFIRQQFKNFRFPSLRGPLVLQGWGYDTTGKPIPNSADGWGHAIHGEFRKENLTDKFMKNWLQNPKTWPVGPVDLRFDRERGVWTCPSPNKIVVARLKEKLSPNSSASAELINPEADGIRFYENYSISGPNGENVKLDMANTQITVYDFLGIELCACDIVYAYYDDNRYIVLESNRAYKDPNEECTDVCTTDTTTTTPGCDWCGLECLQTLPQYNPFIEQILGHDGLGCLKWFDVAECPTPTS